MAVSHASIGPAMREGIDAFFGTGYVQHKPFWSKFYKTITTKKRWAEFLSRSGFSTMEERAILGPTAAEDPGIGYIVQIMPRSYGKKFGIAHETKDDDINNFSKDLVKQLLECARETEAVLAHVPLNDGFTTNGYDGVPLFSASHPTIPGGTYSNIITAADLSVDLLESFHIAISDAQDDTGNQIYLKPKLLLVPTEMEWTAKQILGSPAALGAMNDTLNPAHNWVSWMGSPYLSDPDAVFLFTNCQDGGVAIKRKAPYLLYDTDNDTLADYVWMHMRIVYSWLNPRWCYACAGQG